jgi:serine/threonine-protein kinase
VNSLGKYQIVGTLGKGAMGIVYKGFDPIIERHVALKTILKERLAEGDGRDLLTRFKAEAQAAGRLVHPNIVQVYDYGEDAETAFIVMEYVEGRGLREFLRVRQSISLIEAGRLMDQLLDALAYAHARGVVHRDIKPPNLLINPANQLKVTDFGIARLGDMHLTQVGSVMGTPSYMAPEQIEGLAVDGRADLFSAGVVLYELLTGRKPFEGATESIAYQILHTPHQPPTTLNALLNERFDNVIARALAKKRDERYPDAKTFARELVEAIAVHEANAQEPTILSTITVEVGSDRGSSAGGSGSREPQSQSRSTTWDRTDLKPITEMLMRSVGPVAQVLVRKTAASTTDPTHFAAKLAEHIDNEADRTRFLEKARTVLPQVPQVPLGTMAPATKNSQTMPPTGNLDAATIDKAAARLASHVGPIAKVLAKKAAAQTQQRTEFLTLLSERIESPAERAGFLKYFGL